MLVADRPPDPTDDFERPGGLFGVECQYVPLDGQFLGLGDDDPLDSDIPGIVAGDGFGQRPGEFGAEQCLRRCLLDLAVVPFSARCLELGVP